MPHKIYDPHALIARIERVRAKPGPYFDMWGVRWDRPGLPVNYFFPPSRVYWQEVPEGEIVPGTCAIEDVELIEVMTDPDVSERDIRFCGTPYIVCGEWVDAIANDGEVVINYCRIAALIDTCRSTRGVPLTYETAKYDDQWHIAVHEAAHAYVGHYYDVGVNYVQICGFGEGTKAGLGGSCRTVGVPDLWATAVLSAAGLHAVNVVDVDECQRSLAHRAAADDYASVEAVRPYDRDAKEWRLAVEKDTRKIVTEGKQAIIALALALMAGRNHNGYCLLTRPKIERILNTADPRMPALCKQPKYDGMVQGVRPKASL
jgi:hypothetical protein